VNDNVVSYAVIAGLIGEAKALELSKKRGGRALYIPSPERLGPTTPVVAMLGPDVAEKLAARFGGTHIDVPLGPGKRARIWELREGGKSISAIAGVMNCTERTVYYILSGPRPKALGAPPASELPPLLAFIAKR
jgi:hypothetical protein